MIKIFTNTHSSLFHRPPPKKKKKSRRHSLIQSSQASLHRDSATCVSFTVDHKSFSFSFHCLLVYHSIVHKVISNRHETLKSCCGEDLITICEFEKQYSPFLLLQFQLCEFIIVINDKECSFTCQNMTWCVIDVWIVY